MKPVRWGICGTGAMAEMFATALSKVPGAILHGVASRSRACAGEFATRCGILHPYPDYTALLLDSAIDIVYIATRNEYHHDDSLAAINSGKAVLCEKPFALNASEGRRVVQAARQRGVFCAEAMWMRFSPAVRSVVEIIRSNGIGQLGFVSAQLGVRIPFDPDHRVYAKPGGGSLYDFGVYPLSFTHALLGSPLQVQSQALIGRTGVDEQFTALLEYGSGCQALIGASVRTTLGNTAAIYGTDGQIDLIGGLYYPDGYEKKMIDAPAPPQRPSIGARLWRRLARHLPEIRFGGATGHSIREGYASEASAVQRCLQAGLLESPVVPLDETIEILELMDTIRNRWTQ
ncbi:MAG TPA: Gfo/Idh/MocA family oxidoreductase [Terracidiphilus sp.]|nr:Gfo/Idh/MocA family oxidoreductase [Terracidiphilus sp.]